MQEKWKDILGYEKRYEISNKGRIKSSVKHHKILKGFKSSDGFLLITLHKNNKRVRFRVHHLVANAFLNNPDNLKTVLHIDRDKNNNKVDNLKRLSYSEHSVITAHEKYNLRRKERR